MDMLNNSQTFFQAADSGEYTCTVKWKNFTETDSLKISVTSLTTQVSLKAQILNICFDSMISTQKTYFFNW